MKILKMNGSISIGVIKQVLNGRTANPSYIEQRLNLNTGFLIKSVISKDQ